ncbi:3D-(3,5/4)-trihydroxycyclohexane-1,2-dione acylhydrolase (decyclizing) [Evansella caseinilytica]|uniref:3D-(3,5/4)-trihydroxycyclohexane-1,2-dione hydrolase n=1 Tax=Evansella caseinilytica TaxID=1503961 RepID=A0A1H3SUY7_9BACI|nr:3D-(3,5/4)-trihydroxycyclohexane-1,2-dione acylhydrolase (decyclizing) [Evansella caseinilytica]SDZ41764.1 3D-(3,5/4)-trihydroxycyclohexane-1,2-dione acylhydrolase (decyclizing) [Evansella caseinilytica]
MKTLRLTAAQALVRFLENQYLHVDGEEIPFVEGIFNIFGHGNVLGIGQALQERSGRLKVIQGKNEQGMAQAAVAFSKQKLRRQIYAVTSSVGPGSANLVTAAGTALANNIPVLFLPGDTFASRQPDPVLQQLEQEHSIRITTNDALKPVSRYWDRIERPEQLMSAMLRAMEVLTDPAKAGPVTISVAQDVEGEAYDYDEAFLNKRVHYLDRRLPTDREIKEAVRLVKHAKRPVIVVGGGAKYSGAGKQLRKLSEKCSIPLVETQAGKAAVESVFNKNLGGLGVTGTLAANKAVKTADLIIGVGTRYTDFSTSSKTAFDFESAKFLNINVNRMQAYKLDAFQVVADARETLDILAAALEGYRCSFGAVAAGLKAEWELERSRLKDISIHKENYTPEIQDDVGREKLKEYSRVLDTELPQTNAVLKINDVISPSSNVVTSAGSLPGDLQRLWQARQPGTYHAEYGYSAMGYEIAGALGVKLADPANEVYAFVGDGSFLMMHSELLTALQYGKKINILLFDNAGFGCINNLQLEQGGQSYQTEFRDFENQLLKIDYAKIAEGYGAKTYRVKTLEQLEAALEDAQQQTVSTLIDIKVLPKTMTKGYEAWWNVGVSEVSEYPAVQAADRKRKEMLQAAKKY